MRLDVSTIFLVPPECDPNRSPQVPLYLHLKGDGVVSPSTCADETITTYRDTKRVCQISKHPAVKRVRVEGTSSGGRILDSTRQKII